MTADYFPAFLDLRGRRCLVVGGGAVGERKAEALRAAGARVTVVSPAVTPPLARLAARGLLTHRARPFRAADTAGCALVVCATGRLAVDRAAARAARRAGALVNAVDRPALCDLIVPAVVRRGNLQIAVSTGGRSPALAREIRARLERLLPPRVGDLLERLGRARRRARRRAGGARARMAAGDRLARRALGDPALRRLAPHRRPLQGRTGARPPHRCGAGASPQLGSQDQKGKDSRDLATRQSGTRLAGRLTNLRRRP